MPKCANTSASFYRPSISEYDSAEVKSTTSAADSAKGEGDSDNLIGIASEK